MKNERVTVSFDVDLEYESDEGRKYLVDSLLRGSYLNMGGASGEFGLFQMKSVSDSRKVETTVESNPDDELCAYDAYGFKVVAGDWVQFRYGIPRVIVTAQVGEKDGKLFVLCHGHNPDKCELGLLALHVGDWYKVDAPIKGSLRHVR